MLALLWAAVASAGRSPQQWRTAAEDALLSALREQYPQVAQWSMEPLIDQQRAERLQSSIVTQAIVLKRGKRSAVRLSWQIEGRRTSTTVWFSVAGRQNVPTAIAAVRAGAPLTASLAEFVQQDILTLGCTPLSSTAALMGMRARKRLHAGEAICTEAVEPRPPVGRGEQVRVRSTSGAVTIVAKAVAQQDGVLGQVLRVRNASSGQSYLASVSGVGEVAVHE